MTPTGSGHSGGAIGGDAGEIPGFDGGEGGGFGLELGVRVFATKELREIDRLATEEFGLPSLVLMEHAATQLSEAAARVLSIFEQSRVVVVCGPGSNGGDGLAAARHLDAIGCDVHVVVMGPAGSIGGDTAVQLNACLKAGLSVVEVTEGMTEGELDAAVLGVDEDELESEEGVDGPGVLIDALFGTGLSRAPEGLARELIERINGLGAGGVSVIAADIPSGLQADTGEPFEACVRADLTVTFAGLKRGFLELKAQPWLGEVVVGSIGAPRVLLERFGEAMEPDWPDRFGREPGDDEPAPMDPPEGSGRAASRS